MIVVAVVISVAHLISPSLLQLSAAVGGCLLSSCLCRCFSFDSPILCRCYTPSSRTLAPRPVDVVLSINRYNEPVSRRASPGAHPRSPPWHSIVPNHPLSRSPPTLVRENVLQQELPLNRVARNSTQAPPRVPPARLGYPRCAATGQMSVPCRCFSPTCAARRTTSSVSSPT